jgi:hypothetical protein
MLRYLKWLSIAGVWIPLALLAAWGAISWMADIVAPSSGMGMVLIDMLLGFALAHGMAVSSFVGFGLLISRRTTLPVFTMLSATLGAISSMFVLLPVYFNVVW